MRYSTTQTYADMGEFIFRKWMDGELEPDEEFRDDDGNYGFAQFGRRVIVDEEGRGIEYTRHPTVQLACEEIAHLHDTRPPVQWDAIVQEDRRGYAVSIEGARVGEYADRDDAYVALARAMVDYGVFPDAFYVNERGNWHRIDDEIRDLHDAGGDKMREDLR